MCVPGDRYCVHPSCSPHAPQQVPQSFAADPGLVSLCSQGVKVPVSPGELVVEGHNKRVSPSLSELQRDVLELKGRVSDLEENNGGCAHTLTHTLTHRHTDRHTNRDMHTHWHTRTLLHLRTFPAPRSFFRLFFFCEILKAMFPFCVTYFCDFSFHLLNFSISSDFVRRRCGV